MASAPSHVRVKLGMYAANTGPKTTGAQAAATARLAEEIGMESLWVAEHIVIPVDYADVYPYSPTGKLPEGEDKDWPDPFIWLTYAAAVTERIKLATGVTVLPLRNPVITAKQIATLDALSGGRVILGVGVGWLSDEFAALGVPFSKRGRRHDSYLAAMRALWTEEEASYRDEFVDFGAVISRPRPAGSVPIVVSGHSVASVRRVVAVGDGWFPGIATVPELKDLYAVFLAECAAQGRDPGEIEITVVPGGGNTDVLTAEIEEFVAAGVSRILLPRSPDDHLRDLVGTLGERIEILPA
jgi:probable F420-dependent oxidoreductase